MQIYSLKGESMDSAKLIAKYLKDCAAVVLDGAERIVEDVPGVSKVTVTIEVDEHGSTIHTEREY
jgi:hypothetical protein